MLPFLKPRKLSSTTVVHTKASGGMDEMYPEDEMHPGLVSAMDEFLSAHSQKDSTAMAKAMHSFHSICNSSADPEDAE